MALTGSFTEYTPTYHETEKTSITMQFPVDLPESDENYELRGTTSSIEIPVVVDVATTYSGSYVYVTAASVHTVGANDEQNLVNLHYIYKVYSSSEAKNTNFSSYLTEGSETLTWNYVDNSNPTETAYNHLKTLQGSEDLIDC